MIDAYCSLPHYVAHVAPIWRELDRRGLAGDFFTPRLELGGKQLTGRDAARTDRPMMVAGYTDAVKWTQRPVIYVEHGAGQTYQADRVSAEMGSYSGGAGLDMVRLFLCPSETVADRWRTRYDAPAVAVGCPKMDRHHQALGTARDVADPVIAITFHWDLGLIPETRWAYPHYKDILRPLREMVEASGARLIGHGHPRAMRSLPEFYEKAGIQWVPDLDTVFATADLLIVDNSSAGYEFASLGRPTIWMNAPWYRRGVDHGMRFWQDIPGIQVDDVTELLDAVPRAIADPPEIRLERERVIREVYAYTDGRAAERAVDAIRSCF